MIRLALRGLLARRVATALAAAGLLTAVSGFLVLAGVSRTTQVVLSGDITRAWNTPYDILVRPPGSQTALEQTEGLVRPNFLSGLTGGITEAQLAAIRGVPNVAVAAPIAVVGFVQWPAGFPIDLSGDVGPGLVTVLRVTAAASGEAGLSQYPPLPAQYLVIAPQGRIVRPPAGPTGPPGAPLLDVGTLKIACSAAVACYGGLTPDMSTGGALSSGTPGLFIGWSEPIVVAGVDPVAEATLAHLDRCVVAGRYLSGSDAPTTVQVQTGPQAAIPVLVSSRSFIDETARITVERAADPSAILGGAAPDSLGAWTPVREQTATANDAYQAYLSTLLGAAYYDASPHWTAGPVTYRLVGPDHLAAEVQPADPGVYESLTTVRGGARPISLAPMEASDVWFRSIAREDQIPRAELFSRWQPVGQYDPDCLPGFDPLAGGRLEAYGLPQVRLADGGTLGPTRSLASYVNSPPLVLTTLAGAAWLSDPARFTGAPGAAFISAIRVKVAGVATPGPAAEAKLASVAVALHDATGLQVDIVKGSSPRTVLGAVPLSLAVAGIAGLMPALLVLRGRPIGELASLERQRGSRPIRWLSWLAVSDLAGPRAVETALGVLAVSLGAILVGAMTLVAVAFNGRLDATVLGVYLAAQVRPFHLAIAGLTLAVGALAAGEIVSLGYLRREVAFATLRAVGWSPRLVVRFLVVQAMTIGLLGGLVGAAVTLVVAWVLQAAAGPTELGVATAIGAALVATLAAAVGPALLALRAVPAAILRGE